MPYISPEALVGGAFLVVLALAYQYVAAGAQGPASRNKKKSKKKTKGGQAAQPVAAADPVVDATSVGSKGAVESAASSSASTRPAAPAPATPARSTPPSKPKTLADKIAPKARKTKVDDMLAPEDLPAKHARVLRVVDPSAPAPAPTLGPASPPAEPASKVATFSDDSANSQDKGADDGWNVVASKPKKSASLPIRGSSNTASTPSTALPVATKLQKKNAKKNEAKKAAKANEEADRQQRLRAHKKDLERQRINEIYATKNKGANGQSSSRSTATPTIDSNGKLIWD